MTAPAKPLETPTMGLEQRLRMQRVFWRFCGVDATASETGVAFEPAPQPIAAASSR